MLRTLLHRVLVVCLLVAGCWHCALAQVDAQLTQYWAVPAYYNPAATGNTDFIHITGVSRLQWVGIGVACLGLILTQIACNRKRSSTS